MGLAGADVVRPAYAGACVANLTPALLGPADGPWLPAPVAGAEAAVLLVLDGLGWPAVGGNGPLLPNLSTLAGGPITTVVPSTTAAALTSITTGVPPSRHGVVGYRMRTGGAVLDVLRWKVPEGRPPEPAAICPVDAFCGRSVPVVTRAEFTKTGFSGAHLRGCRFEPWRTTSTLVTHVARLVSEGERFVFAYYDGVDKVAHEYGLDGPYFPAELSAADRLVGDLLDALPERAVLVITADHGQVPFTRWLAPAEVPAIASRVAAWAGDARFRYLHARAGAAVDLYKAALDTYGDVALVLTRDELVDDGWLGPDPPAGDHLARIGDVTLAAGSDVVFVDPTHPFETRLRAGHGSLSAEEMLVPLLAGRGRARDSGVNGVHQRRQS